ncbi:MAG: class I SAM-dependent methyltransferase [Flavobacteriaceae bacterium]|nr:class I SAM-dependent methyltransferase [Flavobacteriaceae bacterium]
MWYQVRSYFLFLLKSSNQHGIHSPFVYDFVTKCVYDKSIDTSYRTLKNIRKKLLQNNKSISITDFGAGSRVFKSNERKISSIAKNAGITYKRQKLLFRISRYFQSKRILEFGTSVGLATSAMALSNESKVDTVEGCKNTSDVAQSIFSEYNLDNINLHTSTFEDFISTTNSEAYDLIYVDGNHNKEKTLEYFNYLLHKVTNNSIIIFDDIYWSPQMNEAWLEICQNNKVTVSIDMFYWGLIFFRKEQQKEHFVIRM